MRKVKVDYEKRHKQALILLFALAIVIRVIYLLEYRFHSPFYDFLLLDSEVYTRGAKAIASGDWLGSEVFYGAPLYPYLLAVIYRFLSDEYLLVHLLQSGIGLLSLWLLYSIARRAFNRRTGLIAVVVALFYPTLIFYETKIMATTVSVFLSLLVILWLLKTRDNPTPKNWVIGGVLFGISVLTRPAGLLFLFFIPVWIWIGFSEPIKKRLIFISSLIFGLCLTVGPVTLRNYAVGKDFVLISSQGGITFYQGNNPKARGLYVSLSEFSGSPLTQGQEEKELAQKDLGRPLKRSEVTKYWLGKGVRFILKHPLRYVKLEFLKLYRFLNNFEYSGEYNILLEKDYIKVLHLLFVPYAVIISFGVWGLIISRRKWRELSLFYFFIAANLLVMLLFFVSSRYRLPIVPVLILFASVGIYDTYEKLRSRMDLGHLVPLAVIPVMLLISLSKLDRAHEFQLGGGHYNLGNHFFDKKEYEKAIREYRKNLEINPRSLFTLYNLGNTYYVTGRMKEALATYKRVVKVKYHFKTAHLKMARIYEKRGEIAQAIREYEIFLEKNPDSQQANKALKRLRGFGPE